MSLPLCWSCSSHPLLETKKGRLTQEALGGLVWRTVTASTLLLFTQRSYWGWKVWSSFPSQRLETAVVALEYLCLFLHKNLKLQDTTKVVICTRRIPWAFRTLIVLLRSCWERGDVSTLSRKIVHVFLHQWVFCPCSSGWSCNHLTFLDSVGWLAASHMGVPNYPFP